MEDLGSVFGEAVEDDEGPYTPDVEPTFGQPVQLEGRYEVDPIPGGKHFQGAWLVLDDGSRYLIAYRPVAKHFQYADKRVRIRGRPYVPGRDTQHIMATHLEVGSIELAPGETSYDPAPTELPLPPLARTSGELAALAGRWVRLVGMLLSVEDDPDSYLDGAHLRLADGTEIKARDVPGSRWAPYLGQLVTVTSRLEHLGGAETAAFVLVGWYRICPGEATGCGTQPQERKDSDAARDHL